MKKIKEMIKDNKEMIIPILVGFTLVSSIYNTIKIRDLEYEIGHVENETNDVRWMGDGERDELSDRIYDIEKRLNMR